MSDTITLREANQNFARYVRDVEQGRSYTITRRGQAVAQLVPVGKKRVLTPKQEEAWRRTRERMEKGYDLGGWTFTRDELHER